MGTPAYPELAPAVQLVAIHVDGACLQPVCNIHSPSFARAKPVQRRRPFMTIVATLMLTAIALYVLVQVDDLRSR